MRQIAAPSPASRWLTARHELNHRVEAAEMGAAGYLVKPCEPDRLMLAIDAAVQSAGL